MQGKLNRETWRKTLWKIVTNPTVEVVTLLIVVLGAFWIVVQTETLHRGPDVPVLGHK